MSKLTLTQLFLPDGSYLNSDLVEQQGLTADDVRVLVLLHFQKDEIMRQAHEKIRAIENQMQMAWGFEVDENRHTHRHRVPSPDVAFPLHELYAKLETNKTNED